MINIRKLETELWEAADLLRADSKVTSQQYCMPVLGLIFLRYAYSRFRFVEAEILKNRPMRNGRVLPVEADDFKTKSAIFLPEEARYDYLLNLPDNTDMGQAINHAMELVEAQSAQLKGILPKNYTILQNDLLRELLRIFNNSAFNEMKDDIIGRIYEYFLNKFAPAVASDDGVFFTPKSLVRMIVNVIEPKHGTVLDPACGSAVDLVLRIGAGVGFQASVFEEITAHKGNILHRVLNADGEGSLRHVADRHLRNIAKLAVQNVKKGGVGNHGASFAHLTADAKRGMLMERVDQNMIRRDSRALKDQLAKQVANVSSHHQHIRRNDQNGVLTVRKRERVEIDRIEHAVRVTHFIISRKRGTQRGRNIHPCKACL